MPIAKRLVTTRSEPERAILVGMELKGRANLWPLDASLEELAQLAHTAGAQVVDAVSQRLEAPTHYYLGTGKLEDLKAQVEQSGCPVVIFDDELTPTQQRNLEEALKVKVIDRTALILDIFARHAHTREGQLQVELAQHQYLLPRLAGQWSHLERLGGGIGTRGPGEAQIETDRRLVRRRIQRLQQELAEVQRQRALYRSRRKDRGIPVVSLVGYTNAGKSTLFNTLSRASVSADDQLFSTLDPVTRRIRLPDGEPILITDTVGFIHKLPPSLVAAFRATLEELGEASLILHVIDITHSRAAEQAQVVEDTLRDLGLQSKPKLLVLNKIDLLVPEEEATGSDSWLLRQGYDHTASVVISAAKGWQVARLLSLVQEELARTQPRVAGTAGLASG
ncbi:MAG: GTPase HflX [Dehalococcoidia bacterium]